MPQWTASTSSRSALSPPHHIHATNTLQIDLTNLTLATGTANNPDSSSNAALLGGALQAAKQSLGMQDYYTIYLRSYCGWNGDDTYANCTDPKSYFWFNPIKVWGLNSTGTPVNEYLPKRFIDGLDTYHAASKAMFILYAAALAATCATLVVGISAIFSRWGSFFTTFFAEAACILFVGASIVASTIIFVLRTVLNRELKDDYGIKTSVGGRSMALTWIGTAFAVGAGFFWLLSVCCCSGRSPYNSGGKEARRTRAEKTPYTYERVGSPYLGPREGQSVPLQNFGGGDQRGSAYEPFRPQHV
jgi:succinate dehydrogenase/fumarate reductase cytochrome b subunit